MGIVAVFEDDHSSVAVGKDSSKKKSGRHNVVVTRLKQDESESLESLLKIKLPRLKVLACRSKNKSGSFSLDTDLTGRRVIIYATGENNGGFHSAFVGTVERASHQSSHPFVLSVERRISQSEWHRL